MTTCHDAENTLHYYYYYYYIQQPISTCIYKNIDNMPQSVIVSFLQVLIMACLLLLLSNYGTVFLSGPLYVRRATKTSWE